MKSNRYISQWFDYLRNTLTPGERHAIERAKLQDPFLSDALDGFEQISANELENDLNELNHKLIAKTNKPKIIRLKTLLPYAAGLAILITIGILLINNSTNQLELEKTSDAITVGEEMKNNQILKGSEQQIIADTFETKPPINENQLALQTSNDKTITQSNDKKTTPIESSTFKKELLSNGVESKIADKTIVSNETDYSENTEIRRETEQIAVSAAPAVLATYENQQISGKILDVSTHEPIAGAIISSGNSRSIITDQDGAFTVDISTDTLVHIAFIGYETRKINTADLNESNNPIYLKPQELAMDEVVVAKSSNRKIQAPSQASSKKIENIESSWITIGYLDSNAVHARPIGGENKLAQYIRNNSKFKPENPVKVKLLIWVEAFGILSEIEVMESPSANYSQEAIRLLKEGPEWVPAQKNGVPTKERLIINLTFQSN